MEVSSDNEQLAGTTWSSDSAVEEGQYETEQPEESVEGDLDGTGSWESCSSVAADGDVDFIIGLEVEYALEDQYGSCQVVPSDEVSLHNVLLLVRAGFPSYGSVNHEAWQCKPCDFSVHRKRRGRICHFGVMCMFCHCFHRKRVVAQQARTDSQVGLVANVVLSI